MKFHHVLALAFLALATPAFAQNNITVKGSVAATDCVQFVNKFQIQSAGAPCTTGGGTGAPSTATYITQTANSTLSAEQAMGSLATGLVKNTTTTGVQSIVVPGAGVEGWIAAPATSAIAAAQFTAVELGAATDTTISRASAGRIAVEGQTVPQLNAAQTWTAAQTQSGNPQFYVTATASQAGLVSATNTIVQFNNKSSSAGDVGSAFDNTTNYEWCPAWTGPVFLSAAVGELTGTIAVGTESLIQIMRGTTGAETAFRTVRMRNGSADSAEGLQISTMDVATSTTCYRVNTFITTTSGTWTIHANSFFSGRAF
jgi:hypothetical protein